MKESIDVLINERVSGNSVVTTGYILAGSFPSCSVIKKGPKGLLGDELWSEKMAGV